MFKINISSLTPTVKPHGVVPTIICPLCAVNKLKYFPNGDLPP